MILGCFLMEIRQFDSYLIISFRNASYLKKVPENVSLFEKKYQRKSKKLRCAEASRRNFSLYQTDSIKATRRWSRRQRSQVRLDHETRPQLAASHSPHILQ